MDTERFLFIRSRSKSPLLLSVKYSLIAIIITSQGYHHLYWRKHRMKPRNSVLHDAGFGISWKMHCMQTIVFLRPLPLVYRTLNFVVVTVRPSCEGQVTEEALVLISLARKKHSIFHWLNNIDTLLHFRLPRKFAPAAPAIILAQRKSFGKNCSITVSFDHYFDNTPRLAKRWRGNYGNWLRKNGRRSEPN